ncbi:flagellar hook capping protein [Verrucomicrobiia bacterium DG1235]|nr:flagellar hook capping protein [Verrucomicrobiae bacterium DG1235]
MPTDAIGSTTQTLENVTTTNSASSGQDRIEQKALGQDEFFKLLTTQLASQDPLEPMEDTAFIAQMASFSELEMTSNLTKSFDNFNSTQQFASAHGYIGKTVSLSSGEVGEVTSVERQNGQTLVFLDGSNTDGRDIGTIYRVESTDSPAISSSRQVANTTDESETTEEVEEQSSSAVAKQSVGSQSTDGSAEDGDSEGIDAPARRT